MSPNLSALKHAAHAGHRFCTECATQLATAREIKHHMCLKCIKRLMGQCGKRC